MSTTEFDRLLKRVAAANARDVEVYFDAAEFEQWERDHGIDPNNHPPEDPRPAAVKRVLDLLNTMGCSTRPGLQADDHRQWIAQTSHTR